MQDDNSQEITLKHALQNLYAEFLSFRKTWDMKNYNQYRKITNKLSKYFKQYKQVKKLQSRTKKKRKISKILKGLKKWIPAN